MINLSSTRWLAAAAFAMALLAPSPGVAAGKPKDAGVDHSRFAALQENFATGPEVTHACLGPATPRRPSRSTRRSTGSGST